MVKGDEALAWLRSTGLPARLVSQRGRPGHAGRLAAGGGGMNEALWALGRGTGVVALVMFTADAWCWASSPARAARSAGLGRFGLNEVHRTAALTGVGLIAVHLTSLFFDPYAQLEARRPRGALRGQLPPSLARAWARSRSTCSLVITAVSLLRNRVGPRVFRAVHWLTYALWPVALLHGLGTGTDAGSLWMDAVAVALLGGRRRRRRLAAAPVVRRTRPRPHPAGGGPMTDCCSRPAGTDRLLGRRAGPTRSPISTPLR